MFCTQEVADPRNGGGSESLNAALITITTDQIKFNTHESISEQDKVVSSVLVGKVCETKALSIPTLKTQFRDVFAK